MNFNEQHTLENDIVLLRPLQASDYSLLRPYSVNEPEMRQAKELMPYC